MIEMIDSPVPSGLEIVGTLAVLFGAPFATVITIITLFDIAALFHSGGRVARFTVDSAQDVASGFARLKSQNWGQLIMLAATQAIWVGAVYLAVRWTMFFPRYPWLNQTTSWPDRFGYLLETPVPNAPESVAGFIALGVAVILTLATVGPGTSVVRLARGLNAAVGGLAFLIGACSAVAGVVGMVFFSLSSFTARGSVRTDAVTSVEIAKDEISRDSAATLLLLGLLYLFAWSAVLLARVTEKSIRQRRAM